MGKDNFKEQMKKDFDELFDAINNFEFDKDMFSEKTKEKYHEIMAQIKQLEALLEYKSRQMREGGDPDWEETKKAFRRSAQSFREALENLVSFVKKEPEDFTKDDRTDYEI